MLQTLSDIHELLIDFNLLSVAVRLILAMILGGAIGLERGIKGRAAGMRTYMLVCIGAALVMITNQFLTTRYGIGDPARMGAQVISGIGFLGAGTIIITRDRQIRGLTTAAGLWTAACLGLAIGVGFYSGAIVGVVLILLITGFMHRLDNKIGSRSRWFDLYVQLDSPAHVRQFLTHLRSEGIRVSQFETVRQKDRDRDRTYIELFLSVHLPKKTFRDDLIAKLDEIEYVEYIEEL